MTLSISKVALPFIVVAVVLFSLIAVPFVNAQTGSGDITACTLRAEINAEEYQAITGTPGGPILAGPLALNVPEAGTNAIMCTYGLVKWASNIIFIIVFTVAILLLAWAAFLYITAGQNPARAGQARQVIIYAVIGLIVAGLARVIPAISRGLIGV